MSRKTQSSLVYSKESAPAWTINPTPSRLLVVWHVVVHAVAAVAFLVCGLAWPLKALGTVAVLAHAVFRRPPRAVPLRLLADGSWALPTLGLERLALRPGTAVGPFWVRLRLGAGSSVVVVLLLEDQLDRVSWRRLQAELRRSRVAGML